MITSNQLTLILIACTFISTFSVLLIMWCMKTYDTIVKYFQDHPVKFTKRGRGRFES